MCDYQGYEFGAGSYPDSYCVDGQLFDADDEMEPMDYIPCPMCCPEAAVAHWTESFSGNGSRRKARKAARSLVMDIRRNRGVETLRNEALA